MNGFVAGDPAAAAPARSVSDRVDVLIIGCGPAGLTLAAQLAAFPDLAVRIVEQKPGPLRLGQADGVACRTMEMFAAFGFAHRVLQEAYWVNETVFWKPAPAAPARIARSSRIEDTEPGLSEFPHVILNQARVHDFYLERMAAAGLYPDYSRRLESLSADETGVTAVLDHAGVPETIRARYVVGCDGARSTVRKSLGLELHGDSANQAWGVMDVLAITDFPDVRLKAVIQSQAEGSVLIIPREGGYLVRLYIELDKLAPGERIASRNITPEYLVAQAQRILHPYSLEVKEIAWWSAYEIGQRLCDEFADEACRIFIAGDACHTHSPKAGQGMNVSMQDGFNLGWKLAAVLRGQAAPALLQTYSAERQAVAAELIAFDRKFAAMFSAPPRSASNPDGVDPAEFQAYFQAQGRFTAGTQTRYHPSAITAPPTFQALAHGFPIGMRFHSAPVIRLADAKPMQLGHAAPADGRWRLYLFAGASPAPLEDLCKFLAESPDSPVLKHGAAVFDIRAIFQQPHRTVALAEMPAILRPASGKYGLTDYEKIFCADPAADIFALRQVDRNGCIVVVRPDQYVAHILPLGAHTALAAFFAGFMLPRVQTSRLSELCQSQ